MYNQTFLFYDLETTGINNSFDQVLQFAAIRTDMALNEIERYDFLVKLNPDTTPSPMASITHHIPIARANAQGVPEYDAIRKIHKIINTPNTISIGYNTLGFDDEFLRFAFFRNMLPPYTHQYKNACFRADLFPVVACYYNFCNEALKWPTATNDDGAEKISLKLENINNENKLYSGGRAHDAITDVIVTVELAKKLKLAKPEMWQFLMQRFYKQNDEQTLSKLDGGVELNGRAYHQAIAIAGIFGAKNNFMTAILDIGQHRHYKNQEIFLRLDNVLFAEHIEKYEKLQNEHWRLTVNKKWGDIPIILPAKTRFVGKLPKERLEIIKENKKFIQDNAELFNDFVDYVLEYKYPEIENIDIGASIYQSDFMTVADEKGCDKFHTSKFDDKVRMLNQLPKSYYDRAVRILGKLNFEKLPQQAQIEFQEYLNKIVSLDEDELLIDHRGKKRTTLEELYNQIQIVKHTDGITQEQHQLLEELEEYYNF